MTLPTPRRSSAGRSAAVLLGLFFVCYAVAALGAFLTISEIPTWYAALAKPSFNPPNSIFAPVWTTLYGLMAIAAWLVWRTPGFGRDAGYRQSGLVLFTIQLLLNALWTATFFHFHQPLLALVVIVLLWIAILLATLRFSEVDRFAGTLMLLYLAWVSFATALNYAIYRLN